MGAGLVIAHVFVWIAAFTLVVAALLTLYSAFRVFREIWDELPEGWWRKPAAITLGICLALAAAAATWVAATFPYQTEPEPAIPYPEQGWPDGRAFQSTPLTGGFSEPPE